ncbi:sensor histidine kinase [Candidatus Laterigemmans baculatus]|uniref:sensor histidine kinase n=1 Tax=Candidatus Laterigemmans baculatus TaxID=2770505 RepID=UPI0013D9F059|nr:ATP-binding protein [Candidatus Laterigemmans baculatus]
MPSEANSSTGIGQRGISRRRLITRPWEIAFAYAVLGALWVAVSDQLLRRWVLDPDHLLLWNACKGIGFVSVTAVLLLILLQRTFQTIGSAYDSMQKSEGALRNEQVFTDAMIEGMPGILYIYDFAGRFLRWNRNLEVISGYTSEEVGQMHPRDFFATEDQPLIEQRMAQVFTQGEASVAATVVTKNGNLLPFFLYGRRVEFEHQTCLVGFGIDTSDRMEREAEREKRRRAEAADRLKSSFLATMSHELRTPLNSIIGFSGILLQELPGPLNAEQQKQLEMVQSSARHLLALVNDLLDISKIEANQLEVAHEPFDLQRSIGKVIQLVEPMAAAKHLQLRVEVADDLGETMGDERRFEQILLNLLGNAIKFTEQGEVGIEAFVRRGPPLPKELTPPASATAKPGEEEGSGSSPEFRGDLEVRSGLAEPLYLQVQVSDTGTGIQPEELPQLFQPFRQLDSGSSRKQDGTGLGLAICRRLAELMKGEIRAESAWGQGSTFSLTLPLQRPTPS